MNKFLAFALFALVASVSCSPIDEWSQAEAASEGNVETELLLGNEKLFSDYCVNQGQKVKSDLSNFARETNAYIVQIFFGNLNGITDEVVNVQKDVVAQLTAQLAKPTTEASSEEPISEDQIAKLVHEGRRSIAESNSVASVVPATKTALQAMLSAANSAVFARLAKARAAVSSINLYQAFKDGCDRIAQYEADMATALDETKSEILASVDDAETKSFVESTTVSNLNCFTTKNIVRLHGFCDIVQAGHVHFFKMLGMSSPLTKLEQQ